MTNNFSNESLGSGVLNDSLGTKAPKKANNRVGELRIVATIVDADDKIIGYSVMSEKTRQIKNYTSQQTMALMNKFKFTNAELNTGKIVNTECSMNSILRIAPNGIPVGNIGITILYELVDKTGKNVGYRVMDAKAVVVDLTEAEIVQLCETKQIPLLNGKLVHKGNKEFISAIKNEFPTLLKEVDSKKNTAPKPVKLTPSQAWRNKKHREKLFNITMFATLNKALRSDHVKQPSSIIYSIDTPAMRSGVNIKKELNIILKEIAAPLCKDDKNKEILAGMEKWIAANAQEHVEYPGHDFSENDAIAFVMVSQFILKDENMYKRVFKESRYRFRLSKGGDLYQIRELGLMIPETEKMILELGEFRRKLTGESADQILKDVAKRFNTWSFKSGEDIAQLGFAIVEKNKNYEYETDNGGLKTLKYLGDYFYATDYNKMKAQATCLGDLLILANIETLLRYRKTDEEALRRARHAFYYHLPATRIINAKIEMLLAILALYNPTLAKTFIDSIVGEYNEFSFYIPNFDENTDYAIDESIRIYYESGCCVFYNDYRMDAAGSLEAMKAVDLDYDLRRSCSAKMAVYYRSHLIKSELINYRNLGPKKTIMNDLLYTELAPIVSMITSDDCSSDLVGRFIGQLRIL